MTKFLTMEILDNKIEIQNRKKGTKEEEKKIDKIEEPKKSSKIEEKKQDESNTWY